MIPGRIADSNLTLSAPEEWAGPGKCHSLVARAARDEMGGITLTTAWFPTDAELKRIAAGAPVYLTILGNTHPPVALGVGPEPA